MVMSVFPIQILIAIRSRFSWFSTCPRYPLFCFLYVLFTIIHLQSCSAGDCLAEGEKISGVDGSTLISPGRIFELGFFNPDGNSDGSRYLGIWYYSSNPKIVVWVANREKPLSERTGYVVISDLSAKLLDVTGTNYWSTGSFGSSQPTKIARSLPSSNLPNSTRLCLRDTGDLVLESGGDIFQTLWRSFYHPTDTLLPGMSLDGGLNLTSWYTSSNPAPGSYALRRKSGAEEELVISMATIADYWDSDVNPSDKMPPILYELTGDKVRNASQYKHSRLLMGSTGQVQLWMSHDGKGWSLLWWEPKSRCSLRNACGNFGTCNSNNKLPCKCLPGYKPSLRERWSEGCYFGGCMPKSGSPCQRSSYLSDKFLSLTTMRVEKAGYNESSDDDCESKCRQACYCVAYSCGNSSNCKQTGASSKKTCLMWYDGLTDLQEEYPGGLTIFIRTAVSDIEPTPRSCSPCGAYVIPYPLSTSATCGDSSYFNFHCNAATGQVNFSTPSGTFRVASIDPDSKAFSIRVPNAKSCETSYVKSLVFPPMFSLPFNVRSCSIRKDSYSLGGKQSFVEVDMEWEPAPEPACNVSSDCLGWRHTTCKAKDGQMRCICGSKFLWDGQKLGCTRVDKVQLSFKVLIPCIMGALAIVLFSGVLYIQHIRNRRIGHRQGSSISKGSTHDSEGIDVPFFTWENILAATNDFADANKLGTGGFGPVYKGKLSDGNEIAVKRLSSVSVQGIEEFKTEVVLIAKLQHRNLVRLLGYCVNDDEKILVYEYMPNGSLDSCLFEDRTCSVFLDWKKRYDIILGIARGLLYLHRDSRLRIIHRDLKPSNILLDDELNPKISDFGTAKIVGGKETEASTGRIVGTYGYMSPEYAYEGLFSVKSDVFSFGVVVLEAISGRRNSKYSQLVHGISLLGLAWRLWSEGRPLDLMDQTLAESCNQMEVLKCIHIGLLCVQGLHAYRPTMSTVLLMLSSENPSLPLPKEPAFFTDGQPSETTVSSSLSDLGLNNVVALSPIGG